jgi:polar amino acid transport system ATP-binding protein
MMPPNPAQVPVSQALQFTATSAPEEASRPVVIEARGIRKSFGSFEVLRGVDLKVHRGEVVVIIGPSGSGKSTFLRTLNHLDVPNAGSIWINGAPFGISMRNGKAQAISDSAISMQRRMIGMVFQQFNLFGHMSALDNVRCGPVQVLGRKPDVAEAQARRLLALVGLSGKETSYPAQLSGGQQQRVAIARALAMDPAAMLFDEPTSALDPEMVGEVLNVMLDLAAKGMTMVIVTHEIQFARKAADRILFMEDGMIVEEGRPAEMVDSPRHERTRRFLRMVGGAA